MGYTLVWVHGAGLIQPGYSTAWVAAYNPYLNFHDPPDSYIETYWAEVFQIQSEVDEARVRLALKTAFLARVTASMESQGLANAWSAFTNWVAQGEAALPDWVVNHDAYLEEFAKYLADPQVREAAKEEVKKKLRPLVGNESACSVFAHSWGSVVAYEGLLELAEELPAVRFAYLFTLGSPLWLVHLLLDEKSGRKPGNVARWVNIYAQGDLVGGPLKPGFQVDQDYAVPSFGNDPHGSYMLPGNVVVERDIVADKILGRERLGPN